MTLFPSVWRESGCKSHFILWHDAILWCDRFEEGNVEPPFEHYELENQVAGVLTSDYRPYSDIAALLGEVPWEVARVCRRLVRAGLAEQGAGNQRDWYRMSQGTR